MPFVSVNVNSVTRGRTPYSSWRMAEHTSGTSHAKFQPSLITLNPGTTFFWKFEYRKSMWWDTSHNKNKNSSTLKVLKWPLPDVLPEQWHKILKKFKKFGHPRFKLGIITSHLTFSSSPFIEFFWIFTDLISSSVFASREIISTYIDITKLNKRLWITTPMPSTTNNIILWKSQIFVQNLLHRDRKSQKWSITIPPLTN